MDGPFVLAINHVAVPIKMSLSGHFSRPGLRDVFCVEAQKLNMVEHVDEDKHVYAIMYHKSTLNWR